MIFEQNINDQIRQSSQLCVDLFPRDFYLTLTCIEVVTRLASEVDWQVSFLNLLPMIYINQTNNEIPKLPFNSAQIGRGKGPLISLAFQGFFYLPDQDWLFGLDQMYVTTRSKVWCTFGQGVFLLGLGIAIAMGVEEKSTVRMFKRIVMPWEICRHGHFQLRPLVS